MFVFSFLINLSNRVSSNSQTPRKHSQKTEQGSITRRLLRSVTTNIVLFKNALNEREVLRLDSDTLAVDGREIDTYI